MAKQIYIDENGNEQLVSGTINNAQMLPISANDPTNTKDYIDNNDFRYAVIDISSLSTTANAAQTLGTLATLTSNKVTSYTQIASLSLIYGAGANYSSTGCVVVNAGNSIVFYPFRTDTNVSIRIVILYRPNALV